MCVCVYAQSDKFASGWIFACCSCWCLLFYISNFIITFWNKKKPANYLVMAFSIVFDLKNFKNQMEYIKKQKKKKSSRYLSDIAYYVCLCVFRIFRKFMQISSSVCRVLIVLFVCVVNEFFPSLLFSVEVNCRVVSIFRDQFICIFNYNLFRACCYLAGRLKVNKS